MELFSLTGVAILLALGVTFLNGFTDAPNSIATTVATGALSMNRACALSAICNFLGLTVSLLVNASVAKSILDGVELGAKRGKARQNHIEQNFKRRRQACRFRKRN